MIDLVYKGGECVCVLGSERRSEFLGVREGEDREGGQAIKD